MVPCLVSFSLSPAKNLNPQQTSRTSSMHSKFSFYIGSNGGKNLAWSPIVPFFWCDSIPFCWIHFKHNFIDIFTNAYKLNSLLFRNDLATLGNTFVARILMTTFIQLSTSLLFETMSSHVINFLFGLVFAHEDPFAFMYSILFFPRLHSLLFVRKIRWSCPY